MQFSSMKLIFQCYNYRKLQTVLTNRILRFLHDKSTKETNEFNLFYKDYGIFLKEGIVSNTEQIQKVYQFLFILCGYVFCSI